MRHSKPLETDTATIEPYRFNLPQKLNVGSVGCCFACSHKLQKPFVRAICLEDNKHRDFHIICWTSNRDDNGPGTFKNRRISAAYCREIEAKLSARTPKE